MNNYKKYNNCLWNKNVEFKNIKVSENKISATAVTKYEQYREEGPEEFTGYIYKEVPFSIFKVDGKWLVMNTLI